MLTQDACSWLGHLPRGGGGPERRPRSSLAEADAFLASFGDPSGTAARRADLITELRERLPMTKLADQVIEAIASATGGG